MREIKRHQFIRQDTHEIEYAEAPMFDGLQYGVNMAQQTATNVSHYVYNHPLGHWDAICLHHPDGTSTNSFGQTQRFTGDRNGHWWQEVEPKNRIEQ